MTANLRCSLRNKRKTSGNKTLQSISVSKLFAHPANPNRMSKASFGKLVKHIAKSCNYEPIIVREHPEKVGCFEIINGHHRYRALKQTGYDEVDCIVWEVDDAEALVLLSTLNRLGGKDDVGKKSEIIKRLREKFSTTELAKILPDSKKQIERLKDLEKPVSISLVSVKPFAEPLVFVLTDEQRLIVDKAIGLAGESRAGESCAARKTAGLVKIAESFLQGLAV